MRLIRDQKETMAYDYDIVVIGGGPAGYAGAIRAAQLKKRVLCVEHDKLGGICLNWGCIPTKALLTNAHLVELIKNHGTQFGYSGQPTWDFAQMIKRSRSVAGQLNKGIEGLFRKYKVSSKFGVAKVVAPHIVQVDGETVTAESIVIATGVRPAPAARRRVRRQDDHLLQRGDVAADPAAIDADHRRRADRPGIRLLLQRDRHQGHGRRAAGPDPARRRRGGFGRPCSKSLTKRGLTILTGSKTTKLDKTATGVKAEVETPKGKVTVEADVMLVAIGVLGNVEGLVADDLKLEIVKNHIKADPKNGYVTSVPGIYAVGDVIGPPWLAHVAHHEAVCCIERLCGFADRTVDYTNIPGCTYTDPGVASVGPDREGRPRGRPRGPHRQVPVPCSAAAPWRRTRPRASSSSSSTPSTASSWAPT